MKPNNALLPVALFAFTLVACQQQNDDNIAIDDTSNTANAAVEALPPSESSGNETTNRDNGATESSSTDTTAAMIPAQYRGRWGMNEADCDPARADNKGLITIGDTTIRFYEATATLKEQRPAIATSFSGLFGFTGEGQTWEKVMTFTRTGDTLKRAEPEGNFTYRRCA